MGRSSAPLKDEWSFKIAIDGSALSHLFLLWFALFRPGKLPLIEDQPDQVAAILSITANPQFHVSDVNAKIKVTDTSSNTTRPSSNKR